MLLLLCGVLSLEGGCSPPYGHTSPSHLVTNTLSMTRVCSCGQSPGYQHAVYDMGVPNMTKRAHVL